MVVSIVIFLLIASLVFIFTAEGVTESAKGISTGIAVVAILWIVIFEIF